jgi:hypothetical protein
MMTRLIPNMETDAIDETLARGSVKNSPDISSQRAARRAEALGRGSSRFATRRTSA